MTDMVAEQTAFCNKDHLLLFPNFSPGIVDKGNLEESGMLLL
jgi:hypothetical protein